jgi:hypothetical protein
VFFAICGNTQLPRRQPAARYVGMDRRLQNVSSFGLAQRFDSQYEAVGFLNANPQHVGVNEAG